MAGSRLDSSSNDLFVALLHSGSICYFSLLTANFIKNFLNYPVLQAKDALPDVVALLCFFLGVIACSSSYVLARYWRGLEHIGVVILIWASTIPFLYFQFYHDRWSLLILSFTISFIAVRCVSAAIHQPGPESFKWACVEFGLLTLLPTLYAFARTSASRYPMVPEFIKYLGFNTVGGLIYVLRPLETWGLFTNLKISHFLMHVGIIGAAITFSGTLLEAYSSKTSPVK
jgi:predicted membrane channel-forming protein YqfA (hemolysin III family)